MTFQYVVKVGYHRKCVLRFGVITRGREKNEVGIHSCNMRSPGESKTNYANMREHNTHIGPKNMIFNTLNSSTKEEIAIRNVDCPSKYQKLTIFYKIIEKS